MVQGNAFVPRSIKNRNQGIRGSVSRVMSLVDVSDPAFRRIAAVLQSFRDGGVELDAAAVSIAVQLGRHEHQAAEAQAPATPTPTRKSIVYYIRRGDLIKIGTTTDPEGRLRELLPDAILAFEPGDAILEATRHRQFGHCRVSRRGEYFRPTEALAKHIACLREEHGDPDPAWPTTGTLTNGFKRTRFREALPAPTTDETATPTEAAKKIGVKRDTIQGWAHRGLIKPIGTNAEGRPMYSVEHMRIIRERNSAWYGRRDAQLGRPIDLQPRS